MDGALGSWTGLLGYEMRRASHLCEARLMCLPTGVVWLETGIQVTLTRKLAGSSNKLTWLYVERGSDLAEGYERRGDFASFDAAQVGVADARDARKWALFESGVFSRLHDHLTKRMLDLLCRGTLFGHYVSLSYHMSSL